MWPTRVRAGPNTGDSSVDAAAAAAGVVEGTGAGVGALVKECLVLRTTKFGVGELIGEEGDTSVLLVGEDGSELPLLMGFVFAHGS